MLNPNSREELLARILDGDGPPGLPPPPIGPPGDGWAMERVVDENGKRLVVAGDSGVFVWKTPKKAASYRPGPE